MSELRNEINRRRTFAIISHPDAGKTTLTEKLLLYGGAIQTAGAVKGKSADHHAVSDWMEMEKKRGISITSSVMQFEYDGYCINILDTPGHQDFSEDTYRTLMAADSAVMVIDGAKGVEPQTRKLFKVCAMRHIPIFTFVNKMDRDTKDPFDLLDEVERELGIETYAMNWPIGSGKDFQGVYDREKAELIFFSGVSGKNKAGKESVDLYDSRVAEQVVQRCISRGYGLQRAKQALYEKKVPKQYWEDALADYPDQLEKIVDFLRDRLGEEYDERELKRAIDALMRRGHSYAVIRKALNRLQLDQEEFPEDY